MKEILPETRNKQDEEIRCKERKRKKKEEQKSKILGVCICNQPFSSSAHIGTVGAHHKFKSFHGLGDLLHQILSWRERKNHRTGLAISFLAVTNIPN